jgi:hypothetical protein
MTFVKCLVHLAVVVPSIIAVIVNILNQPDAYTYETTLGISG